MKKLTITLAVCLITLLTATAQQPNPRGKGGRGNMNGKAKHSMQDSLGRSQEGRQWKKDNDDNDDHEGRRDSLHRNHDRGRAWGDSMKRSHAPNMPNGKAKGYGKNKGQGKGQGRSRGNQ